MERKVGEIFEYNGEWYQCVEQPKQHDCATVCELCSFNVIGNCDLDKCSGTYRSDSKSVIFKKLEKVGDPYVAYGLTRQKYKLHVPLVITNEILDENISCDEVNVIIDIRAKQNKEDMKEKKLNLKEFNLEAAKAGKPVCTRDGRKARIICWDKKGLVPIVALIEHENSEIFLAYYNNGRHTIRERSDNDLMMLTEKKEGWVNVYENDICGIHQTKEEALVNINTGGNYIDTVKIEWEE